MLILESGGGSKGGEEGEGDRSTPLGVEAGEPKGALGNRGGHLLLVRGSVERAM